jgi:SAM-dependent methyltransferase
MSNEEQLEYWNGEAGERWAKDDATMERLLRPVTEALLDHARIKDSTSALDVGCGGGSQSILLGQSLGPDARVLGVDISAPMLKVAAGKTGQLPADCAAVEFLQADVSSHQFAADSFDLVFSRFGVMFFDDPVAAFSNIRTALRANSRVAFCCWQSLKDNDWTFIPFQAAMQHVPAPQKTDPHAPGPFAFADPERVRGILQRAGFGEIALYSFNSTLRFSEADTFEQSVRDLATVGPVARLLADQPDEILESVFLSMEQVLQPFYSDGALCMSSSFWFVTARAI